MFARYGDRFEGEYAKGNRSGHGVYYSGNGERYEGEWKNGKRNGQGVYSFVNGDTYTGHYEDGMENGKGIYTSVASGMSQVSLFLRYAVVASCSLSRRPCIQQPHTLPIFTPLSEHTHTHTHTHTGRQMEGWYGKEVHR